MEDVKKSFFLQRWKLSSFGETVALLYRVILSKVAANVTHLPDKYPGPLSTLISTDEKHTEY